MLLERKNTILGIGGMSRSGKTTLSLRLKAYFSAKNVCVFHLDDYAIPEDQIPTIRDRIDWETPKSIDFISLEADIKAAIDQFDVIIAEGFLIYYSERLRKLFDKKIYIKVSEQLFWQRRREQYNEPDWYIQYVWDNYHKIHSKFRNNCDWVIDADNKEELNNWIDQLADFNHSPKI